MPLHVPSAAFAHALRLSHVLLCTTDRKCPSLRARRSVSDSRLVLILVASWILLSVPAGPDAALPSHMLSLSLKSAKARRKEADRCVRRRTAATVT